MIRIGLSVIALLAGPALQAQTIESAVGDWSSIPEMPARAPLTLSNGAMERIDAIVAGGQCPAAGRKDRIRLDVPVLVQFENTGKPLRVVVRKMGCPEVEQIVGNAALQSARARKFQPTGVNQTGWYRSEIRYHFN